MVTTWFPREDDPLQALFVARHVDAIATRHDVTVLVLGGSRPAQSAVAGVRVTGIPLVRHDPRSVALALKEVHRRAAYADVVHSMAFSTLLVLAVKRPRRPWVHSEHWSGVAWPAEVNILWRSLSWFRFALRAPDAVTAVSDYLARVSRRFGAGNCTFVVPNVVTGPATPPSREGDALRLLAVGNLVSSKRPLLAVRTIAWLAGQGHDVRLRWVGSGPLLDQALASAAALGIGDRVEFTGRLTPEQLEPQFAWSSQFFLPTGFETFCVAAAEALVRGRPVVLAGVGGHTEFVGAAQGEVVDPATPDGLGAAVLAVRNRFRDASSEQIARSVRHRWSADVVADGFGRVYRAVTE